MQDNKTESLVKKAKNRESDAFSQLMLLYKKDMYRVALAILMNDEDTADAIQDTILTCWEKIHSLRQTAVRTYHCIRRETNITEEYDSEEYYGFYIPDHVMSAMDSEMDLAVAAHNMLDLFDGAVLTVTVTFTDGSSFTKEYELSTAKLIQDENGTVTQEEWTGGDEGAFVYGIVARKKIGEGNPAAKQLAAGFLVLGILLLYP